MTEPLLELRGLTKSYDGFLAVSEVSLSAARGEIVALLGPNGAGKTTTIRMLMGILAPSAGTAIIAGHDCFGARAEVMQHVGYLPDDPVFYDHLRGGEIVRFCGEMRGMPREAVNERTQELATRLELRSDLDEFAVNYSMGMKKKLALICAMLHRPDVLLLDEPTNGLDPVATRALLLLIRETAAAGAAVLYSTHLLDQAERLCHRVGILHRGRLAALGTLDELRAQLASGGTLEDLFFQIAGGGEPTTPTTTTATTDAPPPATAETNQPPESGTP